MPVELISKIKPKTSGGGAGEFPMVEDIDLEGGYQIRNDVADRDSIYTLNRKEGMLVFTIVEQTTWRLLGDLLTWVAVEQSVQLEQPGAARPLRQQLLDGLAALGACEAGLQRALEASEHPDLIRDHHAAGRRAAW